MAKYIDIDHEIQEMQQVIEMRKDSHTFENEVAAYAFKSIIEKFQSLPPADVAPVVHGEWLIEDVVQDQVIIICSVCKQKFYNRKFTEYPNYCSNCGAKNKVKKYG